ncbi:MULTISPECIES: helix-turn-helix domain-containing protein [Nonomuraea]|uniref:Helix-turn-helix domain-containing protein n=1 Tax=Nonomuraea wenchangensis TaxID=568860 RepID=A0A1I0KQB2_9ACTN|nr:helix-turn-helix transcriptional regulator [Nonomuraea wenchangensis]SEU27458.1 Helix-turn-helix domain-containing protein [Nonomuraea wenchangensis]
MSSDLGNLLASRRQELGLNQRVIADHLGLSQSAISDFEQGKRLPTHAQMIKLTEILKIRLGQLYDRSPNDRDESDSDDVERAIAESKLDRKQQDALLMFYGCLRQRDSIGNVAWLRYRLPAERDEAQSPS